VSLAIKKSPPLTVINHHSASIVPVGAGIAVPAEGRPTSHVIGAEKPVSFSITVKSVEFLTYN
jgi:hypothetical protein